MLALNLPDERCEIGLVIRRRVYPSFRESDFVHPPLYLLLLTHGAYLILTAMMFLNRNRNKR